MEDTLEKANAIAKDIIQTFEDERQLFLKRSLLINELERMNILLMDEGKHPVNIPSVMR